MNPLITIVICNKNYGHWIDHAINSVRLEGYNNCQICIVDDCSTDNSVEVVSKICNMDVSSRGPYSGQIDNIPVKLIVNNKSKGPSAARNLAMKLGWADTKYFGILDADDMYLPGKIVKSINILEKDENIGAVYTDYHIFDGHIYRTEFKEPYSIEKLHRDCIIHSACIIRKSVLEQVGVYDEEMLTAEDWDLWLRISDKYLFYHIPEPLMIVRAGQHSSSNYRSQEVWQQNWQKIQQRIHQRRAG